MPYMLSLERMAMERGRQEERQVRRDRQSNLLVKQLQRKLGELPEPLVNVIRELDFEELEALGEAVFDLESVPQVAERLVISTDLETQAAGVRPALLLKLAIASLGEIPEPLQPQILQLPPEQARVLARELLQWESQAQLTEWLEQQPTDS